MKILLDECITKKFKQYFNNYVCFTVFELGMSGTKNGKLLTFCDENNIDVLITIDKNIYNQQNLVNFNVSIIILNSTSSKVEYLAEFISQIEETLINLEKSKVYILNS